MVRAWNYKIQKLPASHSAANACCTKLAFNFHIGLHIDHGLRQEYVTGTSRPCVAEPLKEDLWVGPCMHHHMHIYVQP